MTSGNAFREALVEVYRANPCQVLPHPLWQTLAQLDDFELAVGRSGEAVNRLEAWDENSIYIYWRSTGRQPSLLVRRRLETVQLALMHQDFLDSPMVAGFSQTRQPYYRLLHDHSQLPSSALPEGFCFENIRLDVEQARLLAMIAHSESEYRPGNDRIEHWQQQPIFDPELWFWVKDSAIGMPVGVVIGVVDPTVGEAVLEWVQVIPAYQQRGLGRALVNELLRRTAQRALFTTVTGAFPYYERTNPGAFFRKSSFGGEDVWWLLAR